MNTYYVVSWLSLTGDIRSKVYMRHNSCIRKAANLIHDNNCIGEIWIDRYTNNELTNREFIINERG